MVQSRISSALTPPRTLPRLIVTSVCWRFFYFDNFTSRDFDNREKTPNILESFPLLLQTHESLFGVVVMWNDPVKHIKEFDFPPGHCRDLVLPAFVLTLISEIQYSWILETWALLSLTLGSLFIVKLKCGLIQSRTKTLNSHRVLKT